MLVMRSMGEIQPRNIHPGPHQVINHLCRPACWSQRANDFCSSELHSIQPLVVPAPIPKFPDDGSEALHRLVRGEVEPCSVGGYFLPANASTTE
jgi:hypothetical protein